LPSAQCDPRWHDLQPRWRHACITTAYLCTPVALERTVPDDRGDNLMRQIDIHRLADEAYVGQFYPMAVRSTGIGWASGIGRAGAILAPIVIGVLVAMKLPLQQNFLAIAVPALVAAAAIASIDQRRSASAAAPATRSDAGIDEPMALAAQPE